MLFLDYINNENDARKSSPEKKTQIDWNDVEYLGKYNVCRISQEKKNKNSLKLSFIIVKCSVQYNPNVRSSHFFTPRVFLIIQRFANMFFFLFFLEENAMVLAS
jgi:hypothetical protein